MRRCSLDELNVIEGVRKAAKTGVVNGKGRLAHCERCGQRGSAFHPDP